MADAVYSSQCHMRVAPGAAAQTLRASSFCITATQKDTHTQAASQVLQVPLATEPSQRTDAPMTEQPVGPLRVPAAACAEGTAGWETGKTKNALTQDQSRETESLQSQVNTERQDDQQQGAKRGQDWQSVETTAAAEREDPLQACAARGKRSAGSLVVIKVPVESGWILERVEEAVSTVADVKRCLTRRRGIPPNAFCLMSRGRVLGGAECVSRNCCGESELELKVTARGGGGGGGGGWSQPRFVSDTIATVAAAPAQAEASGEAVAGAGASPPAETGAMQSDKEEIARLQRELASVEQAKVAAVQEKDAEIQRLTSTLVSPAGTSTEEALQREMASLKESIHILQEKNSQLQNEVSKLQLKLRLSTSQPASGEGAGTEEVGAVAVSLAEAKAETFKPPKDIMPETDMEWKGAVRHEESKKAGAFTSLFNGIDKNGDGTISGKDLEDSLHEIPALVLAESVKLRDLRERLKSPGETVSFKEFEMVAKDLFRCRYSSICSSAQFGETLTDLLMNALMEGSGEVWKEEADALHPLKSLAALSDEECRALVLEKCESALPTVVTRLVLMMKAEGQYSAEQKAIADPNGKFDGQLVLCPPRTFSVGLEVMIGYPAMASDEAVLKKMMEEHCNGDLATKEFDAYNAGKKRTTTSKEQFEKLLPDGIENNISTCDYEGKKMLQDGELFEKHGKAVKAGLKKYEVLALRLYTGPMYAAYNRWLRALGAAVDKKLPEVREENFASGDETAQMEEAIKRAREEVGEFQFVTTLHALNGALIKLGAITALPPGGKVFRGVAGIQAPDKFLHPNEYGCRVGTECGLMSMTINKDVAIGYMGADKRHKQMFEVEVDHINRGADLDWCSVFPGEKEMLYPPNSCLEVKGGSRYEFSDKGLILVWMLRASINLKGKTIEDFQAMRQSLLVPMANNGLREVSEFLASTGRIEAPADSPPRRLPDTILKQCQDTVTRLKDKRAEDFNKDAIYSSSVQDVLMLVPWAKALTALQSEMPDEKELGLLEIKDFLPSAKTGGDDGVVAAKAAAAMGLCRRKGLVTVHLEGQDEKGRTALHRCAEEDKLQEVQLLIACGARIEALDLKKRTPLHLAIQGGGADGDTLPERTGHTASKLVDLKADVNAADVQGKTVLIYAVEAKLEALCIKMVEKGADVNCQYWDPWGFNKHVLIHAVEAKLEALCIKMVEKGADVNCQYEERTVIMYAIDNELQELAEKLIEKGADVQAEGPNRKGVLDYANEKNFTALADKIKRKIENAEG